MVLSLTTLKPFDYFLMVPEDASTYHNRGLARSNQLGELRWCYH